MLYVLWQVSSWCGRRGRHAGADSTVKMITTAPEARHPAAGGAPPPSRRLHPGGAGRRRRRRLHLRAALPTLRRVHGRLGWRAPRPPAVACFGIWVVGHLKRVLRLSLHVFARVCVSLSVIFCDVACTMGCGGFAVVLSVGLPSGDPLRVSEAPSWTQKRLIRTRSCTQTKEIPIVKTACTAVAARS